MISIIVPIYNVKRYLVEAIESVLNQSYTDFELILVDDGSTDGSGVICDYFAKKDCRIRVIHQVNKGLSAARNIGLDNCRGEYIVFFDSDDVLNNKMLSKMYDVLINSDADIVECNYAICNTDKKIEFSRISNFKKSELVNEGKYSKREALNLQLQFKISSFVWNKLYKRSVWNKLRFHEGHNYEDRDIILPLLNKIKKIYIINDVLIIHRIRKGSITTTNNFNNCKDLLLAYSHYFSYINNNISEYIDTEVLNDALLMYYKLLLSEYFKILTRRVTYRKKYTILLNKNINEIKKELFCQNVVLELSLLHLFILIFRLLFQLLFTEYISYLESFI